MVSWTPQQLREWHEQLMELLVATPTLTYEQLANMLDVHKQSVMLVVNSDLFQAKLRERREARQKLLDRTIVERIESVAKVSLDALETKIKRQRELLGLDEVRETAEMALRGLGYISNAPKVNNQTQINVLLSKDDLAQARSLMKPAIDAEDEGASGVGSDPRSDPRLGAQ